MILTPNNLSDLEYESFFDLWEISKHLRNFYRLIRIDSEELDDAKQRLIEARISMDNARLQLINLLQSDRNTYLLNNKLQAAWNLLMDNLARIDDRLDTVENKTLEELEKGADGAKRSKAFPRLKQYQGALIPIVESIIYQPMITAQKRFYNEPITKDGKEIKRDDNLFAYLIFVAMFNASQQLGNLYRTSGTTSKKTEGSKNLGASTNASITVQEVPENAETLENPIVKDIVSEFSFPSDEGGNNELQVTTTF